MSQLPPSTNYQGQPYTNNHPHFPSHMPPQQPQPSLPPPPQNQQPPLLQQQSLPSYQQQPPAPSASTSGIQFSSQVVSQDEKKNSNSASSSIKRSGSGTSTTTPKVSAFVTKLFTMLEDDDLSHLIWWSRVNQNDDTTFALLPGAEFAQCLTSYFKHGNVASFVRQLHMYGFHKVCDNNSPALPTNEGPYANPNHASPQPIWEFRHSSGKFRRGADDTLHFIKRRSSSSQRSTSNPSEPINVHLLKDASQQHHQYQQNPQLQYHPQQSYDYYQTVDYQPPFYPQYQDMAPQQQQAHIINSRHPDQQHHQQHQQQQPMYDYPSTVFHPTLEYDFNKSRNASITSSINDATEVSFMSSSRNRYPSVFIDPLVPVPTNGANQQQPQQQQPQLQPQQQQPLQYQSHPQQPYQPPHYMNDSTYSQHQYSLHQHQQHPQVQGPPGEQILQKRGFSYPGNIPGVSNLIPAAQEVRLPRSIPNDYYLYPQTHSRTQSPIPQSSSSQIHQTPYYPHQSSQQRQLFLQQQQPQPQPQQLQQPPLAIQQPQHSHAPSISRPPSAQQLHSQQPTAPLRSIPVPQTNSRLNQMRPSVFELQQQNISSVSTGGSNSIFSRTSVGSSMSGLGSTGINMGSSLSSMRNSSLTEGLSNGNHTKSRAAGGLLSNVDSASSTFNTPGTTPTSIISGAGTNKDMYKRSYEGDGNDDNLALTSSSASDKKKLKLSSLVDG